jgi:hypothetical protein
MDFGLYIKRSFAIPQQAYWLVEDFEDFFPFNKAEEDFYTNSDGYTNYNQTTFSRLTVSRVSFDQQPIIKPLKIWKHPTYP